MVIMVGGLIKCDPFTCPGDHLERDDVVGGLAIAQRSWSAQALFPIMPPMVQRFWVDGSGPKPQSVFGSGTPCEQRLHRTRLDSRRTCLGVDLRIGVQMARGVQDQPRADSIPARTMFLHPGSSPACQRLAPRPRRLPPRRRCAAVPPPAVLPGRARHRRSTARGSVRSHREHGQRRVAAAVTLARRSQVTERHSWT